MDSHQADLSFLEIVDSWLRERLSGDQGGILAEMVLHSPGETVGLMHKIAEALRRRRGLGTPAVMPLDGYLQTFQQAASDLSAFMQNAAASELETQAIAACLSEMAAALPSAKDASKPSGLVRLLVSRPHPDLCTKAGGFSSYRKKSKWAAAAKQKGLSKADGDRLNDCAEGLYEACCAAWTTLLEVASGQVLAALIEEAKPILERYREHKRASAQLDFDDLIYAARDLLRDHEAVRQALGQRYARVLVDEFQDTDSLQAEIFLVGDPKQAIYRFRGADVGA